MFLCNKSPIYILAFGRKRWYFFYQMRNRKGTVSVTDKVFSRIRRKGQGAVHTSKDFLDLGSRVAVDHALSNLAKKGLIRRLSRGVYDYPKVNPRLGTL